MIKFAAVLAIALGSSVSFANTGFVPPYVLEAIEKYKAQQAAEAEAEANATVCTDVDGRFLFDSASQTLTVGDRVLKLKCEAGEPAQHPDQGANVWSCVEARGGHGRYSVQVNALGIIPVTIATVSIDQMYPLPAKSLLTFPCEYK